MVNFSAKDDKEFTVVVCQNGREQKRLLCKAPHVDDKNAWADVIMNRQQYANSKQAVAPNQQPNQQNQTFSNSGAQHAPASAPPLYPQQSATVPDHQVPMAVAVGHNGNDGDLPGMWNAEKKAPTYAAPAPAPAPVRP